MKTNFILPIGIFAILTTMPQCPTSPMQLASVVLVVFKAPAQLANVLVEPTLEQHAR